MTSPGRAERRREGSALEYVATTSPRQHPGCDQVALLRICITRRLEALSGTRTVDLMLRWLRQAPELVPARVAVAKSLATMMPSHALLDSSRLPRVAAVRCALSVAPCSTEEHMLSDVLVQ